MPREASAEISAQSVGVRIIYVPYFEPRKSGGGRIRLRISNAIPIFQSVFQYSVPILLVGPKYKTVCFNFQAENLWQGLQLFPA